MEIIIYSKDVNWVDRLGISLTRAQPEFRFRKPKLTCMEPKHSPMDLT